MKLTILICFSFFHQIDLCIDLLMIDGFIRFVFVV